MYKVLFNPLSKSGKNKKVFKILKDEMARINEQYDLTDITKIENVFEYLDTIDLATRILIVGGDGTLHYVLNFLYGKDIKHEIYFFGAGTGNDFVRNANYDGLFIPINKYVNDLPVSEFLGIGRRFVNGCGMGMDAYVCNFVNNGKGKGPIQYKLNTIRGFLKYKPCDMEITVDGVTETHEKVWLISIMNGIYQGGGMQFAPEAIVFDEYVDICLIKGYSRLKVLTLFPKIYKGKHVDYVTIKRCQSVKIKPSRPLFVQLDGEVVTNVDEMLVRRK